jgi:hypothetical protein
MSPRGCFLPTAIALAIVLCAAVATAAHLTLGFRAFTAETTHRLRVAEAPITVSRDSIEKHPLVEKAVPTVAMPES